MTTLGRLYDDPGTKVRRPKTGTRRGSPGAPAGINRRFMFGPGMVMMKGHV